MARHGQTNACVGSDDIGPTTDEHFDSYTRWQEMAAASDRYDRRGQFEQALPKLAVDDLWHGWCGLCERHVRFHVPSVEAGSPTNLREELVCESCGMNARVRAALQIANRLVTLRSSDFYITEQGSRTYLWLQRNLANAIGSEYVLDPAVRQAMDQYLSDLGIDGKMRFEDVTRLTFETASLDAIASFDVLEHVPDYRQALSEFARTLRPGGVLVLTAPFLAGFPETLVRATVSSNGTVTHLQPPEYHGDPAAGSGILCYYHFGWDLLEATRAAGFTKVDMVLPWNPGVGLMGSLWTLTAVR